MGLLRRLMPRLVLLLAATSSLCAAATLLSRDQFGATFSGPNKKIDAMTYDLSGVWEYVRTVPKSDYQGFEICWGYLPYVYRTGDDRYDHLHVSTRTQNVFLMVIKDRRDNTIYGHHLLDLNAEYGMEKPQQLTRKCDKPPAG